MCFRGIREGKDDGQANLDNANGRTKHPAAKRNVRISEEDAQEGYSLRFEWSKRGYPALSGARLAARQFGGVMEWIDIKDRLPPHSTGVLVTDRKIITAARLRNLTKDRLWWCANGFSGCEWEFDFSQAFEDGAITHWMPLPPLPSKDKPQFLTTLGEYIMKHGVVREIPHPTPEMVAEVAAYLGKTPP